MDTPRDAHASGGAGSVRNLAEGVKLDERSEKNLLSVHPDLRKVILRCDAFSPIKFIVVEGLRTLDRQKKLVAAGLSKTEKSRHLTGHAVDIAAMVDVDGDGDIEVTYKSRPYDAIAAHMKQASRFLKIPIIWGGDWKSLVDKMHYELSWKHYPLEPLVA